MVMIPQNHSKTWYFPKRPGNLEIGFIPLKIGFIPQNQCKTLYFTKGPGNLEIDVIPQNQSKKLCISQNVLETWKLP